MHLPNVDYITTDGYDKKMKTYVDKYVQKGFRRLHGDELLSVVKKMQAKAYGNTLPEKPKNK